MRVGLLTRFMGYLGIFTGVLVLFPIGSPVPVVQGFWLLALAYLFSGRWPNGVPPAWRSGSEMSRASRADESISTRPVSSLPPFRPGPAPWPIYISAHLTKTSGSQHPT